MLYWQRHKSHYVRLCDIVFCEGQPFQEQVESPTRRNLSADRWSVWAFSVCLLIFLQQNRKCNISFRCLTIHVQPSVVIVDLPAILRKCQLGDSSFFNSVYTARIVDLCAISYLDNLVVLRRYSNCSFFPHNGYLA